MFVCLEKDVEECRDVSKLDCSNLYSVTWALINTMSKIELYALLYWTFISRQGSSENLYMGANATKIF